MKIGLFNKSITTNGNRHLKIVISFVLLCIIFSFIGISQVTAAEGNLLPGISVQPVKAAPVAGLGIGNSPIQNTPPVLDRSVVSPGGNSLVSPGIVSGRVMEPVSVPGVNLPDRMNGMEKVAPPVKMLKEEGIFVIQSEDQTTRVSVASDGTQGNAGSWVSSISATGSLVAFTSDATNLVDDDTNGITDIFVHNRLTGNTTRVSVNNTGAEGDGMSFSPSISPDGSYVAFSSGSMNFDAAKTNHTEDIYVRDPVAGTTTRRSFNYVDRGDPDANSYTPSIADGGLFVAFMSEATNLVPNDENEKADIFLYNGVLNEIVMVSWNKDHTFGGDDRSENPSIAAIGTHIAFDSIATNLVDDDTNSKKDVFVSNILSTVRVSVNSTGVQGDDDSTLPSLSSDGRYVAFESEATNLVDDDTNGFSDIFVHDGLTHITTRISVNSTGVQADGASHFASVSADGRYVSFTSSATNLVDDDTNGMDDVFVHDRQTGITTRASLDSNGVEGNGFTHGSMISPDGTCVSFASLADNLVSNDTNGVMDIFVRELEESPSDPTITSLSPDTGVNIAPVGVMIVGGNFVDLPNPLHNTVNLTKSGQTNITAVGVTWINETHINCTLPITGKATGLWNVTLTTGGKTVTKTDGFNITEPQSPTITSILPDTGVNTGPVDVMILGTYFVNGTNTVNLTKTGYSGISATNVTWLGPCAINCTLPITGLATGPWNVTLTTGGETVTKPDGFNITAPSTLPTINTITPDTGINTGPIGVTIKGTNFVIGDNTVRLIKTGQTNITANGVSWINATHVTCTLPITGKTPGMWDVILITGGKTAIKENGFNITAPGPVATIIRPATGTVGSSVTATILGTNFHAPAQVWLWNQANLTEIPGTIISQTGSTLIQARFDIPWSAAGGLRNLTVQNPDGKISNLTNSFTVIGPSTPNVTRITPAFGTMGNTVSFSLTGTNFINGLQVNLTKTNQTDIQAQNVRVGSATLASGQFVLPVLGSEGEGAWNLVTQYPSGHNATLTNGFTINPLPGPVASAISPATGTVGNSVTATISGSNFKSPAQVWLWNQANLTEIPGTIISQTGSSSIQAQFNISWSAAGGLRNLTVQNPDGKISNLTNKFTVIGASIPNVTRITPASGPVGTTVPFTLTGTNFINGLQVNLTKTNQTDIQAQNVRVNSATSATGQFVLPPLPLGSEGLGPWDLVTQYPSGHTATLTNGFTICPLPGPVATSISPGTGTVGTSVTATIVGSNFGSPAQVWLWNPANLTEIPGTILSQTGSTSIRAQFDIPWNAAGGLRNLTVQNPDGQTTNLTNRFTVIGASTPNVTRITPASGTIGTIVSVTLTGTNFINGLQMNLTKANQTDIQAQNVRVISPTSATGQFVLLPPVPLPVPPPGGFGDFLGAWDLVTQYPSGHTATLTNGFTINPPPGPAATAISPATGTVGNSVTATIYGTNFGSPAQVWLWNQANLTEIPGAIISQTGSTTIRAQFDIPWSAAGGLRNLTVQNPDGQKNNLTNKFTVIGASTPNVTRITPVSGPVGKTVLFTLTGTNFINGLQVNLTKTNQTDIQAQNVRVNSATSATGLFVLPPLPLGSEGLGPWDLVTQYPSGHTATLTNGFTINPLPGPAATVISPATGTVGNSVTATIYGTNFGSPAQVWLGNQANLTEIPGAIISQTGSTTIRAQFDIPWSAAGGLRNLTVQNPDGQTTNLTNKFTVIGASTPNVTRITPASGTVLNTVSFTLTGTNFINGLQVNLTKANQTDIQAQNVRINSATSATGQFVLPLLDSEGQGAWNLVTQYPSGHNATLLNGFTVNPLPAPRITAISPVAGRNGNTIAATIYGTNFKPPLQVSLWSENDTVINGMSPLPIGSTVIQTQFNLTGAGLGRRNLTVSIVDGQLSNLTNAFTVI